VRFLFQRERVQQFAGAFRWKFLQPRQVGLRRSEMPGLTGEPDRSIFSCCRNRDSPPSFLQIRKRAIELACQDRQRDR
jgi:hypothetical protein